LAQPDAKQVFIVLAGDELLEMYNFHISVKALPPRDQGGRATPPVNPPQADQLPPHGDRRPGQSSDSPGDTEQSGGRVTVARSLEGTHLTVALRGLHRSALEFVRSPS
jgi:hypothetical protein